ncbi:MAG TPA: hypothetical protein VF809_02840 [Candidatus Saccharimonadales bacterium]
MSHVSRKAGLEAEQQVIGEFTDAGWHTYTSPELDYVRKADVRAVCPGYSPFYIQVSLGPKSSGEQERLAARGVLPMSVGTLAAQEVTAAEYVCQNWCERELCSDKLTPIDLPLQ